MDAAGGPSVRLAGARILRAVAEQQGIGNDFDDEDFTMAMKKSLVNAEPN
jgi:hypothetical protein